MLTVMNCGAGEVEAAPAAVLECGVFAPLSFLSRRQEAACTGRTCVAVVFSPEGGSGSIGRAAPAKKKNKSGAKTPHSKTAAAVRLLPHNP
jgi:hypothetical protein